MLFHISKKGGRSIKGAAAVVVVVLAVFALASCAATKPLVKASDQAVQNGTVAIAEVDSAGAGWIVIHADNAGNPGDVVGYTAVKNGKNANVSVTIDTAKATPTLYAMLHVDKGAVGTYEFPGADVPVTGDIGTVSPPFKVTGLPPRVVVSDQKITNGVVTIAQILSDGPGWIVIHADNKGQPGTVVGHAAVPDGLSTNVSVTIDVAKATPTLYAMLHVDKGTVGTYEFPGADVPAQGTINQVSPPFKVTK